MISDQIKQAMHRTRDMKKLIGIFCFLPTLAQATQLVLSFDPVNDPVVTGYRAYFSATQNGPTFQTIDIPNSPLTFDDMRFPGTWYVCVASTNGQGLFSPCSDSVKMDMGKPTRVWPTQGWKSLTALTYDKSKAMQVGGFTWPGPVWSVTGGSYPGVPVPSPVIQIGDIYFCDWPYGLTQCSYQP